MSAPSNPLSTGLDVELRVAKIKSLAFVLRQLVLSASADTGFSWTDDDRDRFEQGSEAIIELIDEQSAAVVNLGYNRNPDEARAAGGVE